MNVPFVVAVRRSRIALCAVELTASPTGTYTYDQLGERSTDTPTSGSATDYSYNQAGELTEVAPPSGTATSYTYDGTGELASATTGSDASHLAWNTTTVVPELLTDGSTSYIYGPAGLPIEQIASDGTVSYLHHDQVGSTRLITDASGDTAATLTYSSYGTLSGSTGTATTSLGYAGQYTDPQTGLEYDQARWYDPTTGQFMTVDPLVQTTSQPYSYANDDPLDDIDPTGLGCGILDPGGCINDAASDAESAGSTVGGWIGGGASTAWSDTEAGANAAWGGIKTGANATWQGAEAGATWTYNHPLEAVGMAAGGVSLVTGVGEVVAGGEAVAEGVRGGISVGSGVVATAADTHYCLAGSGIACVGAAAGGAAGLGGALGAIGANDAVSLGATAIGLTFGGIGVLGDLASDARAATFGNRRSDG